MAEPIIAVDLFAGLFGRTKTSLSAAEGKLSASGVLDWAHFESPNKTNNGSFDGIKNLKRLGTGPFSGIGVGPLAFSWSGGSPTATGSDVRSHIRACGAGAGFTFEVPSGPRTRTIMVYTAAHNGAVEFSLFRKNQDGSESGGAAAIAVQNASGGTFGYYSGDFATAVSKPVRVELRLKAAGGAPITNNSCVSLLAAQLSDAPNGTASFSFSGPFSPSLEGGVYEVQVQATHASGVLGVELFYDNQKVGEDRTPPYSFGLPVHGGVGKMHAEVTTLLGTSVKSAAVTVTGWYRYRNHGVETIPDAGGWVEGALSADTPVAGKTVKAAIAEVWVEHPYVGDLEMKVISPNDKAVLLVRNSGGSGHDFSFTQFNDGAGTPITSGSAPFSGAYRPLEALSGLIGQPSAGRKPWRLSIKDDFASDVGNVNVRNVWLLLD